MLLGGVTGEIGELELAGIYGVNPREDGVVADLVVTKAAAKAVWALVSSRASSWIIR